MPLESDALGTERKLRWAAMDALRVGCIRTVRNLRLAAMDALRTRCLRTKCKQGWQRWMLLESDTQEPNVN